MARVTTSHVLVGSGLTAPLATVLVWASHLPLQPLDEATGGSLALLLIAGALGLRHLWEPSAQDADQPAIEPRQEIKDAA